MATELGVGPGRGGRRGGYGRLADRETGKTEMDSIGLDLGIGGFDLGWTGEDSRREAVLLGWTADVEPAHQPTFVNCTANEFKKNMFLSNCVFHYFIIINRDYKSSSRKLPKTPCKDEKTKLHLYARL
jgi:hypothetical protein